ncbi:DsbA family oxidoreductase [Gallaecimonas xiamenensis]|uniref:DSBA oxidoreductase n=1 Tax=Gallaecimonas xiamenensis 3-C-1 TaxID=745411 RepID=K2JR82_9GAMM|nr:DsbA family oxidoreductase [Gallaecimonas xiamenensis]EKE77032.1 DSBA oxidoreductase [Gallaecimonas xiamenensis 3-C-1]
MNTVKIDFVSDVVCPWCAIGLSALEKAMAQLAGEVAVELRFHPFELNPQMGPEGESIEEHLVAKYGMSPQQLAESQEQIAQRGAALAFHFDMDKRDRIYNTFDAHRLLAWAQTLGNDHQLALKKALLAAYFGQGQNPGDHSLLLALCGQVGLDQDQAKAVLNSDRYAEQVRQEESLFQQRGINAVPAVVLNDKYLISGGQSVDYYAQALKQVAAEG